MNVPPIKDYQFEAFLGEGATGQVYLARNESGRFAVKILRLLAINRRLLSYCLSRLAAAPPHPNLVEIKDFSMEGRPTFISMAEYLQPGTGAPRGYTLDSQCGTLDPPLAWAIIRQIAEGMAHLHKYGAVHCSLNPKNIFVANPDIPEIKIADFGQGWVSEINHIDFSESFLYAPPEQLTTSQAMFEGQAQRWDVYAFGVTAYRLLYKHFPRAQGWIGALREGKVGFHPQALAQAMLKQHELSWPSTRDGFEDQRQRVIERCLMLDPMDRFVDMREVVDQFVRIERDERLSFERKEAEQRERELTEDVATGKKRLHFFRLAAMSLLGVSAISLLANVTSESRMLKKKNELRDMQAKATADIAAAQTAETQARNEADRFKKNLTFSQRTADAFLGVLLKARQPDSPEYQSIDDYLTSAKKHYLRMLSETEGEESLIVERLRAEFGLALIESSEGEPEAAGVKLNKVVSDVRLLPDGVQNLPEVQEIMAGALLETGQMKMNAGLRKGALQAMEESVRVYRQLLNAAPKNAELRRRCGKVYFYYGQLLAQTGDLDRALKSQQTAMQLLEEIAQSSDAREEDEYYLAMCQMEGGLIRYWENEGIEAFESFQLASQGFSRLIDQKPQIPHYRFQLARCFYYLGQLSFQEKGDLTESSRARETTKQLLNMLLEKDEGNRDYQYYLALVVGDLAEMDRDGGKPEEAMSNIDNAIAILSVLHKAQPAQADYQFELALRKAMKGDILVDANKGTEAIVLMKEAQALLEDLKERQLAPAIPEHVYAFEVVNFYGVFLHALESQNLEAEAAALRAEATNAWADLAAKRPNDQRIQDAWEAFKSRP